MRRAIFTGFVLGALFAGVLHGQQPQAPALAQEQLQTYAKAHAAIAQVRDRIQAELAQSQNKKDEAQKELHEKLRQQIAKILQDHGLTDAQYQQITYVISTDPAQRRALDEIMGIAPPKPPPVKPVDAHLAHLTTAFNGTPNGQGLLPTALAEARVAAQHAALAARDNTNLDAMKLHAAHVLHAIDPAAESKGPAAGYGVKKAVSAVVTHIELAAMTEGASANVKTHAVHIATSARNTLERAERIAALANQIRQATTAAEAAALVSQLTSLAEQLIAGADGNGDGRIGWQEGEGGLQHVEQHINLLAQAERS
ncbi:MAG TPA: DUF4168 domain-containing protein [Longimicrobiales bacterium]|nr:DUF4168 domain-containing protein [Longimicrobiales bacterium]